MAMAHKNTDDTVRRATLKQRAADARAHATAEKKWRQHVTAAAVGTLWRVTAAWIEQREGTCCAELTHVGNGTVRVLRVTGTDSAEGCRSIIQSTL